MKNEIFKRIGKRQLEAVNGTLPKHKRTQNIVNFITTR